ncbi:MAG: hypothetical protein H6739_26770 [Alphaproteobacteria bacterium]|nr:hypothetical protein [Alphaproteobacteria bacterium]
MHLFLMFAFAIAASTAAPPADALPVCALQPCPVVAAGIDEVDGLDAVDPDAPYAWLTHDLALARLAVVEGDVDTAAELARAARLTLRAQGDYIADARGQDFVDAMDDAFVAVLADTK